MPPIRLLWPVRMDLMHSSFAPARTLSPSYTSLADLPGQGSQLATSRVAAD